MKAVIQIPQCGILEYEVVEALVNRAYIEGMKRAAEICQANDPHPDQYSEQYEFAEAHIVRKCAKEIFKEADSIEY
jgi:hypothetical protein